jgi:hypothetical protein
MKNMKLNIKTFLLACTLGVAVLYSCKEEETFPETRLFRPVLTDDLLAEENKIMVNMGNMKDAVSYTIEVSRDTFKTIDLTLEVDTNVVEIADLLWNTIYQVQATAHAKDAQFDSKASWLGTVKTQKFPSIMGTPTVNDVIDTDARVFWTTAGATVTGVKIFAGTDVKLTTPLAEFTIAEGEQLAEEKFVGGLTPNTKYQIALYSGSTLRGWEEYTTKPADATGDNVVDMRGQAETNLSTILTAAADGSIIILERGKTYSTGGYKFNKSFTIQSGLSFNPNLAVIDCASNFHVLGGSTVSSILFKNVTLTSSSATGFTSHYVFNPNEGSAINVGEIKFESCRIRKLRGISRFRGTGEITNFTINNCVVDSIGSYGLMVVDATTAIKVQNTNLNNSTFSRCQYFLGSRTTSSSVTIESCTVSESPATGTQIFRWRDASVITNGVSINNTVWGHAWDMGATGTFGVQGFDTAGGAINFNVINTYATSQFAFSGNSIAGFPSFTYSGTDDALWVSPSTLYNGTNFNFKDTGFAGKGDAGDPRWRIGL